jgi:hypothetical protein
MKSNRKRQMRRKRRAVSYVMGEKQEEVSDNSQASEMPQNNSQNRITKIVVEQGQQKIRLAYSPRRGRPEAGKGSAVRCWLLRAAPLV